MAPKTIKKLIADTLEDLGSQNLEKFVSQLLDRREEPRVPRSKVEGKGFLVITDKLVSVFCERGALQVTLETLRDIGCNQEADGLGEHHQALYNVGFVRWRETFERAGFQTPDTFTFEPPPPTSPFSQIHTGLLPEVDINRYRWIDIDGYIDRYHTGSNTTGQHGSQLKQVLLTDIPKKNN